ncbi:cytotoxic T-lymphocyte protein 4 [Mastacembelus armatus]|uniref:CD28 molecule n=1 Tax=Mastacembelus armatus TaxID=205130 RepID=A0A3Q3RHW7_9TELE|nr:cytotoxic T-lymphocyte protein 4-like [Mastacembelus armatus]
MFLTHCVMGWIVLEVLCLSLPVWSAVTVIQPYSVVSTNGTAQVQCVIQPQPFNNQIQPCTNQNPPYPFPVPEELRVTLVKGLYSSEELCSSILNLTGQRQSGVQREAEVQCTAEVREGAVVVTASGLKATHTDMYRCVIEVFYPPPYLQLTGNGTLIHVLESPGCPVQGAERQSSDRGDKETKEDDETEAQISVPVVVLVILIILVLCIIVYFQAGQCQQEKRATIRSVPSGAYKVDAVEFSCENA